MDDLEYATDSNLTPYGGAGSHWERDGDNFQMTVTVPVGSTATVHVPAASPEEVKESGSPLADTACVKYLSTEYGYVVLEIASAEYTFQTGS